MDKQERRKAVVNAVKEVWQIAQQTQNKDDMIEIQTILWLCTFITKHPAYQDKEIRGIAKKAHKKINDLTQEDFENYAAKLKSGVQALQQPKTTINININGRKAGGK